MTPTTLRVMATTYCRSNQQIEDSTRADTREVTYYEPDEITRLFDALPRGSQVARPDGEDADERYLFNGLSLRPSHRGDTKPAMGRLRVR